MKGKTTHDFRVISAVAPMLVLSSRIADVEVTAIATDVFRITLRHRANRREFPTALPRTDWPPANVTIGQVRSKVHFATSEAALRWDLRTGEWEIRDAYGFLVFESPAAGIALQPNHAALTLRLGEREALFGMGGSTEAFNQRGRQREFRAVIGTKRGGSGETDLEGGIPFVISMRDGRAAAMYSAGSALESWDLGRGHPDQWRISASEGTLDLYLFLGPRVPGILKRFIELTGCPNLAPRWVLGYHHMLPGNTRERNLLKWAQTIRQCDWPCDGLYVTTAANQDNSRLKVDAWNSRALQKTAARLKRSGFKLLADDPGMSGRIMAVVAHAGRTRHALRGFQVMRGNVTEGAKSGVLLRQENAFGWSYLSESLRRVLNLGLSGVPVAAVEPAGFPDRPTPELLVRWFQLATFMPLFGNLGTCFENSLEPWKQDQPWGGILRACVKLRYELVPYLYGLLVAAAETGTPIVRPLLWHYPNDPLAAACSDQFLVGENMLVAPVITEGARGRVVYLPRGEWFDFWTGEKILGGGYLVAPAPMERIPVFIRAGAILPLREMSRFIDEAAEDIACLHLWPDGSSRLEWYHDDGTTEGYLAGEWHRRTITATISPRGGQLLIGPAVGMMRASPSVWRVLLRGQNRAHQVKIHGRRQRSHFVPELGLVGFDVMTGDAAVEVSWR